METRQVDVAIIGSGPAGLAAAIECATYGHHTIVIDEFIKKGGRLLGQLHEESKNEWWNGIEESEKLNEKAVEAGVEFYMETSVVNIDKDDNYWVIETSKKAFKSSCVLVATGAAESPIALPGWTLPGVMSIGAAQVMTNVHRVKPGNKGIIIGINALTMAIARELQLAGVEVEGIYTSPYEPNIDAMNSTPNDALDEMGRMAGLAPTIFLRMGSYFIGSDWLRRRVLQFYPSKGISVWGIPIHFNKTVQQIFGREQVEGAMIHKIHADGEIAKSNYDQKELDFVCISGGLYPLAELAAIAGCSFYNIPALGGYVPLHSEKMETTVEGLFVAGNITGIESAKVAIVQGTTAGQSISKFLDKESKTLDERIENSIRLQKQIRAEAPIQFHPDIQSGRKEMQKLWKEHVEQAASFKKQEQISVK